MASTYQSDTIPATPPIEKGGFFFVRGSLFLEDGSAFEGLLPAWQEGVFDGEVVFTTGMTGYEEALTDPSYAGQILTFTYPLIGNYGVPPQERWESSRIHAGGVAVSSACIDWSHGQSVQSLLEWLQSQHVPLIVGIDTRRLTKLLRESGTMLGAISSRRDPPHSFTDPHQQCPGAAVSVPQPIRCGKGHKTVVAVDCGMKENIARILTGKGVTLIRVPYDYDYSSLDYDGLFLSNGPGDPATYTATIAHLRAALHRRKPIFGICLGAQLLALAAGASTFKMRYGHRGHNQPCMEENSGRCFITSQNHGYAVVDDTLPPEWRTTFRNLNDGTVEGIAHRDLPYSAVQFHPEACPGPTDTQWLFDKFIGLL